MTKLNAKDALVRFQLGSIVTPSFNNKPKVYSVILSLARVSSKIIKVSFDYVLKIVKSEIHGMLKGCSDVFKAERHFSVCKSTTGTNKFCLVLILRFDFGFVYILKFCP
jgi:hypothetical protein